MSDPAAAIFSCAQPLSNNNYLLSIVSRLRCMSAGVVAAAVSAAVWRRDWKARPLLRIRYGGQWSEWEERHRR